MKSRFYKTLQDKTFTFAGTVFLKHSERKGWFTQLSVYLSADQKWLAICSYSGKGKGCQNQAVKALGQKVSGKSLDFTIQAVYENTRPEDDVDELDHLKKSVNQWYENVANWLWADRL